MENESKLSEIWQKISGAIAEQEWFIQLKTKWEELDPQSQTNLQIGGGIASVILLFLLVGKLMLGVHSLKKELEEKQSLLSLLDSSNDEMHMLQSSNQAHGDIGGDNWPQYFETTGTTQGIDKGSITTGAPKDTPDSAKSEVKESLMDVSLKHINIKQLIRFTFAIENGSHPVKLRNLAITADADLSGYLSATLSLSAFSVVTKQ